MLAPLSGLYVLNIRLITKVKNFFLMWEMV